MMDIADLTPAERRVWEAFPLGEGVDFRQSPDEDPAAGATWGPERTVRAEVLRALLLAGPVVDGEVAGVRLTGARITGRLNLKYGRIDHPARLRSCHFQEAPELYGAQLRALVFSHSVLPGLRARAARIDGVLRISGCRVAGPVELVGAQISGAFFLDEARLGTPPAPGEPAPADPVPASTTAAGADAHEAVLHLNHASVGADVIGPRLTAYGQVRLNGTTVTGQVDLDDAVLHRPGGTALHAEFLTVGSDLRAMRLRAHGRLNLSGARIPRQLNLAYARIASPGGQALRASSSVIGELWLREAAPIEGTVNLRDAQLDLLHVVPEVWPDRTRLDGLGYRRLAPHLPAAQRLPLLEREEGGFLPYAYEQLTAMYRTAGDEAAARTVQLAKLRRHRRTLPWYARAWGHLQDATVGYGFRPMRSVGWLAALLLAGTVVFTLEHPPPLKSDEAPGFNPVFYTVDLMLPIIGFGQEAAFAPRGGFQWFSYLLIVTGWVLATTIAAGVTRSLSRQ